MPLVIVVDDNLTNRTVLRAMLEHLGAGVLEAFDGVEGLELLNRTRCDLLLADIHMPRMDGLEMVRRMRRGDGPNSDTVTVAVTGDITVSDRELASLGFDGYLTKPVSMADVKAALAIERREPQRRLTLRPRHG